MDKAPTPRRARHDGWTPDRQHNFIAALCYGLSVTAAAATVAMSAQSAYRLRAHPAAAGFRAAWDAAVAPAIVPRGPDLLAFVLACLTDPISLPGLAVARRGPAPAARLIGLIDYGNAGVAKTQKTHPA